jgi:hypothetical protein
LHAAECDTTNQVAASLKSGAQALTLWRAQGDAAAEARVLLLGRQYWKSGQKTFADQHVQDAIALLETPSRELAMALAYWGRRAETRIRGGRTLR